MFKVQSRSRYVILAIQYISGTMATTIPRLFLTFPKFHVHCKKFTDGTKVSPPASGASALTTPAGLQYKKLKFKN